MTPVRSAGTSSAPQPQHYETLLQPVTEKEPNR